MARLQEQFIFDCRYKLLKKLGEGGFSEVWLAEDVTTQVVLVLKVYLPTAQLNEYGVESFRKEFALVYNLNHPNLMKYTYFGICVGNPYLVMPYYDSGSGEDMIGNCGERNAWEFLRDVASGLACLHEQHPAIIHQDIKPANVLLDGRRYVITDFGISANVAKHVFDSSPESGEAMRVGTVPYMAPERFQETDQILVASDIWSLGASLYEILSGKLPYGNDGGKAQNNGAKLEPLSDKYSEELRNVIYQCLAMNPNDRPFAEDLSNFASNQLEQAHLRTSSINISGGGSRKIGKSTGKAMKFVVLGLLALLLLGGGLFGFMKYKQGVQEKQKTEALELSMNRYQEGVAFYEEGKKNGEQQLECFGKALDKFDEAMANEDFNEKSGEVDQLKNIKDDIFKCCVSEIRKNWSIALYDEYENDRVVKYLQLASRINPDDPEIQRLMSKKNSPSSSDMMVE